MIPIDLMQRQYASNMSGMDTDLLNILLHEQKLDNRIPIPRSVAKSTGTSASHRAPTNGAMRLPTHVSGAKVDLVPMPRKM